MAARDYRHIYLPGPDHTRGFTSTRRGRDEPRIPHRDRAGHSSLLEHQWSEVWAEVDTKKEELATVRNGAFVDFFGEPGYDLKYQSLEDLRQGIRLLSVRSVDTEQGTQTVATVFVPNAKRGHFLRKVSEYCDVDKDTKKGRPRNANLIDGVSRIRASVLESFWRPEERAAIPGDSAEWVELWLSTDELDVVAGVEPLLHQLGIEARPGSLVFPERTVRLIKATGAQLESVVELCDEVAEFRIAPPVSSAVLSLENREQSDLVADLLRRASFHESNTAVCILDTGVNNGHALLSPALHVDDMHAVNSNWGVEDHAGHGTLMAGTALWGDLLSLLATGERVDVAHVLESVKILPPGDTQTRRELWGHMTQQGVYLAEIKAPGRRRVNCLAVTATATRGRGEPTSWSAAVDELAFGDERAKRLVLVSAGNADPGAWRNYPDSNLTDEVHDPGQSWNALTVGSYTEKHAIADQQFADWAAIAPTGGLSPSSTTSMAWPSRRWPLKPEIVLEGGNVAGGPNGSLYPHDDLKIISTNRDPQVAQFAPFSETSAATAQAASLAAQVQGMYPEAWPETVRGLLIHSAEWTPALKAQFLRDESKTSYARLLRSCGYGVPSLRRATACAANTLTLVAQAELQPYGRRDGRYVTNQMHIYDLPWPVEELSGLGASPVEMRVTLSYFIQPSPGEIGWKNRYRYPSHLMRFDLNGPTETADQFISRINAEAQDDSEETATTGASANWAIGEARNVGSVHADIWRGTAADLAASNTIAVFPAVGWWRERHHLMRWNESCRYSLIVSISTPREDVDIYTPVAVRVAVPVAVGT